MSLCSVEVVKNVGKYLNVPVGSLCYNTDKVLTTVLEGKNVEGFASIILKLAQKSNKEQTQEQILQFYQWLEFIAMYANQAASSSVFAMTFLQDINKELERKTYLVSQSLSIADIAVFYVLYPVLENLSINEKESLLHLCRWFKHVQAQPNVCKFKAPLPLNTLTLAILAPVVH